MIAVDSGDKIRGNASTAGKVDYSIHGVVSGALKQLADGQLADTEGDLYTATDVGAVASIILVNTEASPVTVNLFIQPSGGTSRRIIPYNLSLSAGHTLFWEGSKAIVMSPNGNILNSGTSGTSGTSGSSGLDGSFYGSSGTSGTSGSVGAAGSSGTSGTSGSVGADGSSGSSGSAGSHGTSGTSGSSSTNAGSSGSSGTSGSSSTNAGSAGTSGTSGSSGSSSSGAGGSGVSREVTQGTHGFSIGNLLYLNATSYAKAKADASSTAEVVGIVSGSSGIDTFTLSGGGYVTGLSDLSAGDTYFLSAATAGDMTTSAPTTAGHISKPVFIADSGSSGYFFNMRGVSITNISGTSGTSGSSGSVGSAGSSGTSGSSMYTPRVTTITSHATPSVNTDICDCVTITALATAITSMTTNLTGTPVNFQRLIFRIKDNGSPREISWGTSFVARGIALPTTTVASKLLTTGFIYDSVSLNWGCVASTQEA